METIWQLLFAEAFVPNGVPLKILRLSPLIFTTVLFVNRIAQFFAITTFMPPYMPYRRPTADGKPAIPSRRLDPAPVLKVWLRTSVERILPGVLAVVMLLRITLLANVLVRPGDLVDTHGRLLYGIGLAFSFAHLPLAPLMMRLENAMKSPQTGEDEIVPLLERWFKVNNIRIWIMDFPLWLVTVGAVIEAIKI